MYLSLLIRPAAKEDVPAILGFIRELAIFEKLEHELIATEEILENSLFGKQKKVADVLIAEWAEKKVGYALFFYSFSTFLGVPGIYLEDLYVQPNYRSKGIGFSLLREIARIAEKEGYGRVEWSVLDWNERALSFYRKLNAVPMSDWTVQRLDRSAIESLAQREKL
ncbi:MAG: GNAT family N-acetyltransferase [Oligoflexia bacterium]|nr:GNAT family N-acetyltransferase [Oligoflexia bacterium]